MVTKSVKSTKCEKAQITNMLRQRSSQFTDYEHTDNNLQSSSINQSINHINQSINQSINWFICTAAQKLD